MLPTKSNTTSSGCTPTSSECVVWQGPNIPCINLCTGDSISDVTYKIAEKLCAIQGAYDLSSLQLGDLATFCTTIAGPPTGTNKTLLAVLDYIVKKLVCVNSKVDGVAPGSTFTEPILGLPTCLQYPDPATGQQITQLIHNQYTLRIANQHCLLKTTVDQHTTIINQHTTDIEILKNRQAAALPTVSPSCSYPAPFNVTKGITTQMNILLGAVEADLCSLRAAVGANPEIIAAAGRFTSSICLGTTNLSQAASIAKPSTTMAGAYSTSWISVPTNLSQSINNLWITVLDMRCAIDALRQCCGKTDCSKVIIAFKASTDSTRQNVIIKIYGESIIDSSYTDVPNFNKITIKDSAGTVIEYRNFSLVAKANTDQNDIVIPVATAGLAPALNTSLAYTVTLVGAVAKDGTTCEKNPLPQDLYPSCQSVTIGSTITQTP